MIDPNNVTKFDRSRADLEEFAIFSVLVAGKTAKTISVCLSRFLAISKAMPIHGKFATPFEYVREFSRLELPSIFKGCGIGCYTNKAYAVFDLASAGLDLKTCTPQALEKIKGIGPKTSRFFILHSRPNQRYAVLDRHILRWMREEHNIPFVPENTPTKHQYERLEKQFLSLCDRLHEDPARLDLYIWTKYSSRKEQS